MLMYHPPFWMFCFYFCFSFVLFDCLFVCLFLFLFCIFVFYLIDCLFVCLFSFCFLLFCFVFIPNALSPQATFVGNVVLPDTGASLKTYSVQFDKLHYDQNTYSLKIYELVKKKKNNNNNNNNNNSSPKWKTTVGLTSCPTNGLSD